jgi:D-alanyl-D-alanine carboxypeptidase
MISRDVQAPIAADDYAARIAAIAAELGISLQIPLERGFKMQIEALDLVDCGIFDPDGSPIFLEPSTAQAWSAMRQAAAHEGLELVLQHGFRSLAQQANLIRSACAAGRCLGEILKLYAVPGFSEHHTGQAVDIACPSCYPTSPQFEGASEYAWLVANSQEFGFFPSYPRGNAHQVVFEPWHWRHYNRKTL